MRILTSLSVVSGVQPVIKKCNCGVGINGAVKPIKLLFIYDGYRRVVVLTDIMVDTNVLICVKLGFYSKKMFDQFLEKKLKKKEFYLNVKTIGCDTIQCCVIQNDNTISATGKTAKSQQGIVWLNNNITGEKNSLLLVME